MISLSQKAHYVIDMDDTLSISRSSTNGTDDDDDDDDDRIISSGSSSQIVMREPHRDDSGSFADKGRPTCRAICYALCQLANCATGECPHGTCVCIRCTEGTVWGFPG